MNLQGPIWACLFATALAHGGHEAVPEGESISQDPIVRYPHSTLITIRHLTFLGRHTMDAHDSNGFGLRLHLPNRNGSRSMYHLRIYPPPRSSLT
jgi:hypothetical protein